MLTHTEMHYWFSECYCVTADLQASDFDAILSPRVCPWRVNLHHGHGDDGELPNCQLHKSVERKDVWTAGRLLRASRLNFWGHLVV